MKRKDQCEGTFDGRLTGGCDDGQRSAQIEQERNEKKGSMSNMKVPKGMAMKSSRVAVNVSVEKVRCSTDWPTDSMDGSEYGLPLSTRHGMTPIDKTVRKGSETHGGQLRVGERIGV